MKSMTYKSNGAELPRISQVLEPFVYGDLFGTETGLTKAIRTTFNSACAECGRTFEAEKRVGRPTRFCCDGCRRASAARQVREWEAAAAIQRPTAPTKCQRCNASMPLRSGGPGRVRRYCSRRCLVRSHDPPRAAGETLFDFIHDEPKESDP